MPAYPDKLLRYKSCRQAVLCCILIAPQIFHCANTNAALPQLAQAGMPGDIAEFQVKAAYLYKFGSYIEWPANTFATTDSPVTIGVRGADALANELIRIAIDHTINGRPVIVRKLAAGDALAGINVLFIGNDMRERMTEILASARSMPILTVTEAEQSLARGSMINFTLVDGRVRFEAAPKAARQSNLTISARLLSAAYRIVAEAP